MIGVTVEVARKLYPAVAGAPARLVHEGLRLDVEPGEVVALLGPSGCGKTTLLNIVAGLDREFEGAVAFADGRVPRLAYVFQAPRLLPWRTVLANVVLALPPGAEARARAGALLDEVGLAGAHDVYPERLSLGMQRRAALARAFAVEPDLLLMDEPFASLDEGTAERLRDLLARLLAASRATTLLVTHDPREALRLADRVVIFAGAPAKVIGDVAVDLDAAARRDPMRIEAARASLTGASLAGASSGGASLAGPGRG